MKYLDVQPSKQIALTVVVFILIIVSMAIIFNFRINKTLETFAIERLALEDLNQYLKGKSCNRKLEFTNFVNQTYNASQRSLSDHVRGRGSCPSSLSQADATPEMSIIEENKISYRLKTMCIRLNYEIFDVDKFNNGNLVSLYLDNSSERIDNFINLLYLFLLNPIYVEFENSTAYIPEYDDSAGGNQQIFTSSYYSNYDRGLILNNKSKTKIPMAFKRLIPANSTSKNSTFNYVEAPELTDLIVNKDGGSVNAKLYYLESQDMQTTGIKMSLDKYYKKENKTDVITIYDKNYQSTYDSTTEDYFFHQKMYVLFQNSHPPIFTFKFEVCITIDNYKNLQSRSVEIFKVYIDTELGKYISCSGYEPIDTKNHNILSGSIYSKYGVQKPKKEKKTMSIQQAMERDDDSQSECTMKKKKSIWDIEERKPFDTTYILSFSTSNNKTVDSCSTDPVGNLDIELPFANANERVIVIVTVSPYEKIALCKWKMEEKEYFTFKRTQKCNTNNNFFNIFSQRANNKTAINENVKLAYDTSFVTKLNYVQLGHKQYLSDYYSSR